MITFVHFFGIYRQFVITSSVFHPISPLLMGEGLLVYKLP